MTGPPSAEPAGGGAPRAGSPDAAGRTGRARDTSAPAGTAAHAAGSALPGPGSGPGSHDVLRVTEYTDPLCPWAWGSEPVFRRLRGLLAGQTRWRRVYGILFDTDDDPAPDPAAETAWYERFVHEVSAHTGAPHAVRLARVAASSWPSSLVAKAAEAQGELIADRVLRRLRESMFVAGEPADTPELALAAARGVPGLDPVLLTADAASARVMEAVRADHRETRDPLPEVLAVDAPGPHPGTAKETSAGAVRYALPTLVVTGPGGRRVVPGRRPLETYLAAVAAVAPDLAATLVPALAPTPGPVDRRRCPEALLAYHRSLTGPEWNLLAPGAKPPPGAVPVGTGNGPLWLHPAEAAVSPLPLVAFPYHADQR